MKIATIAAVALSLSLQMSAQQAWTPEKIWSLPDVPPGPYTDHLAIDLEGSRLFVTPQSEKAVDVLDLKTGKVLRTIRDFGNPHSVLYQAGTNRLFVADGGKGALDVFDGRDYHLLKSIVLLEDADGFAYDPRTKYLYVNNGGEGAGKQYEMISIIDTNTLKVVGEIPLDTDKLEATHINPSLNLIYANLPDKDAVGVIDMKTRKQRSLWSLGEAHYPIAMAADDDRGLLFVGTRDTDVRGSIVVMDAKTGDLKARLPIGGWVDQVDWDPDRKRIYATCGTGQVFTFQRMEDGTFKALLSTDTAVMAKTSLFVPSLKQLFVAVPHLGDSDYRVMIFSIP